MVIFSPFTVLFPQLDFESMSLAPAARKALISGPPTPQSHLRTVQEGGRRFVERLRAFYLDSYFFRERLSAVYGVSRSYAEFLNLVTSEQRGKKAIGPTPSCQKRSTVIDVRLWTSGGRCECDLASARTFISFGNKCKRILKTHR